MDSFDQSTEAIFSFENLHAWQTARLLSRQVCRLLKTFPPEERYALCAQLRRSVVSVASNLAEGSGRINPAEKIHFISIAYGSLSEVYCQLLLAQDLNYISDEAILRIKPLIAEEAKMLRSLRHSFQQAQMQTK